MPSDSDRQRRFFGTVLAYKRGEEKNVSAAVKKAAHEMSEKQIEEFARKPIAPRKHSSRRGHSESMVDRIIRKRGK